jgi:hypothetical protein
MGIGTACKNSSPIIAHWFNNRGYRTYWQKCEVNFIIFLGYLLDPRVGNRKYICLCLQYMRSAELHNFIGTGYERHAILGHSRFSPFSSLI